MCLSFTMKARSLYGVSIWVPLRLWQQVHQVEMERTPPDVDGKAIGCRSRRRGDCLHSWQEPMKPTICGHAAPREGLRRN